MDELLELAITAHGGLDRWNQVTSVSFAASITGALWYVKRKPDVLKDVIVRVYTKEERVDMSFVGQDKRTTFRPDLVALEHKDGTVIEARDDPEESFDDHKRDTPWDDLHVAYFSGEALWTYLNVPFVLARDDFRTEEVPGFDVDGEPWRRLKVSFPEVVKTHTRDQYFCFGPDGLLRRHDYTVDILGGSTGLNFASDYVDVDGIMVPATRRVYAYEGNYELVPDPILVAIDMTDIALS